MFGEGREANEACGKIEGESMAKGFAMVVAQVGRDHILCCSKEECEDHLRFLLCIINLVYNNLDNRVVFIS